MLPSNRTYAFWLGLLRVALGLVWLAHGVPKFTQADRYLPPDGFFAKMAAGGVANTTGPYHDFLVNTVVPNLGVFAELVRVGEVVVGTFLVLGFLSRLAGLGGLFLIANYMLVQGETSSIAGMTGLDGAMLLLCAINVVLPTGRSLGLDWFFARPRRTVAAVAPAAPPPVAPTVTDAGAPVRAEFVDEAPLDGPSAPPN